MVEFRNHVAARFAAWQHSAGSDHLDTRTTAVLDDSSSNLVVGHSELSEANAVSMDIRSVGRLFSLGRWVPVEDMKNFPTSPDRSEVHAASLMACPTPGSGTCVFF